MTTPHADESNIILNGEPMDFSTTVLLEKTQALRHADLTPKERVFGTIRLQILAARERGDIDTERALERALTWEDELADCG